LALTIDVPNAISSGVFERARVDLVDDSRAPPLVRGVSSRSAGALGVRRLQVRRSPLAGRLGRRLVGSLQWPSSQIHFELRPRIGISKIKQMPGELLWRSVLPVCDGWVLGSGGRLGALSPVD
jgi:hypothetical protein